MNAVAMPPSVNALPILQGQFALLKLGGQIGLVERPAPGNGWSDSGDVVAYRKVDAVLLLQRALQHIPSNQNSKAVIKDFFESTSTVVFDSIAYDPRPTGPNVINLWQGPTVKAIPGSFSTIDDFLLDVVADRDCAVHEYLLNFLAHMLQAPERKPGVMLVLLGGQGTGKGTFFRLLNAIWGKSAIMTNQIGQVTGTFNNLLERYYVVWLDEALFVGDRKATDKLKNLITEPYIAVEAKYQTARSVFSCHRFFASANAEHFAHIDADDRRMLYLPMPTRQMGNIAYWTAISATLTSPEVAAFVHHLMQRDISTFKPSTRPVSSALTRQKLLSLTGADAWWHSVLQVGTVEHFGWPGVPIELGATTFISSADLVSAYESHARRTGDRLRSVSQQQLKHNLQRLCPSAQYRRATASGTQVRGYDVPTLAQARSDFASVIGANLVWSL